MNFEVVLRVILITLLAILLKLYLDLKESLTKLEKNSHKKVNTFNTEDQYSSYWCHGQDANDRICHFQTLCFHPTEKHFLFFYDEKSIKEEPASKLSEGKFLTLSSLADLFGNLFSVVDMPAHALHKFQIDWFTETTLFFSRFKPDNLMHVLHDDILPMHHTLGFIHGKNKYERYSVRFFFTDDSEPGDHSDIYEMFTKYDILYKQNLTWHKNIMCFSDAYIGVLRTTTWYQYGFLKPQSMLPDTVVSSSHIRSTADYIIGKYDMCNTCDESDYLVFLSRKETRLILNENELILELARSLKLKIISIASETHSMSDMILLVRKSKGMIGMHGALMSLAIFLPSGSILIELFPYAINPENYTPYKSLASVPGMDLVYKSWTNPDSTKSRGHSDREDILGGIQHLSEEKQQEILNQEVVPPHLCCQDPSWLYHIYQDTEVHIPSVVSLTTVAMKKASILTRRTMEYALRPSAVTKLSCQRLQCQNNQAIVMLSWTKPWNVKYLHYSELRYKILVQKYSAKGYFAYIVSKTNYTLRENLDCNIEYNIWVVASINKTIDAPSSYIKCQT